MNTYLVVSPGERELVVNAKNSTQAKRIACREWGIRPGDKWCGIPGLHARKIKEGGDGDVFSQE